MRHTRHAKRAPKQTHLDAPSYLSIRQHHHLQASAKIEGKSLALKANKRSKNHALKDVTLLTDDQSSELLLEGIVVKHEPVRSLTESPQHTISHLRDVLTLSPEAMANHRVDLSAQYWVNPDCLDNFHVLRPLMHPIAFCIQTSRPITQRPLPKDEGLCIHALPL